MTSPRTSGSTAGSTAIGSASTGSATSPGTTIGTTTAGATAGSRPAGSTAVEVSSPHVGPSDALLSIEDLRVHFATDGGVVKAVDGVSWFVRAGETLGIVGESGSGKSVSAMSIMGLVPQPPATYPSGRIMFQGRDLLQAEKKELRTLRGKQISMIFQDPLTSLNPVFKVGHQIAEVIQVHEKMGRVPARKRAVDLLAEVGIPNPKQRADEYPHQFSGGMRQRAMIAMALALDPVLLLADEPTTALDVTVQAQIMDLLLTLQQERGTAIVLITHDLGLVAAHADRVLVMYAGRVAELADTETVFYRPRHGYTYGLLGSLARLDQRRTDRLKPIPGQPPSLSRVPTGCPFNPRCEFATDICRQVVPALVPQENDLHFASCHHSDEVALAANGRAAAEAVLEAGAPQRTTALGEPVAEPDPAPSGDPLLTGVRAQDGDAEGSRLMASDGSPVGSEAGLPREAGPTSGSVTAAGSPPPSGSQTPSASLPPSGSPPPSGSVPLSGSDARPDGAA